MKFNELECVVCTVDLCFSTPRPVFVFVIHLSRDQNKNYVTLHVLDAKTAQGTNFIAMAKTKFKSYV